MSQESRNHRAGTLERRQALLDAALELVGERGVGAVTHRNVAKRAGLPASTPGYFFASIDDLLLESLREFAAAAIASFDAVGAAVAEQELTTEEAIDGFVALLVAMPVAQLLGQFEAFLQGARRDEFRAEIVAVMDAFRASVRTALHAAGIARADEAAVALVALSDGFALRRVVEPGGDPDGRALRGAISATLAGYSAPPDR